MHKPIYIVCTTLVFHSLCGLLFVLVWHYHIQSYCAICTASHQLIICTVCLCLFGFIIHTHLLCYLYCLLSVQNLPCLFVSIWLYHAHNSFVLCTASYQFSVCTAFLCLFGFITHTHYYDICTTFYQFNICHVFFCLFSFITHRTILFVLPPISLTYVLSFCVYLALSYIQLLCYLYCLLSVQNM